MNQIAKRKGGRKAAGVGQLWLRLPGLIREALYETVIGAGLACVDEVLEAERVMLSANATSIWPIARRCARDTWRVRWCWADGGSRCSGRGRAVWRVASLGYRAGGNGAHAIRWRRGRWSRWCWRIDPGLRALAGAAAGSRCGTGHQQE